MIRPSLEPGRRCDRCGRARPVHYYPEYAASFCERCGADPQAMPSGALDRLAALWWVYYDSLMLTVQAARKAWRKQHPKRDRRNV